MNILLTGASGFIGRNLGAALQAAGHRVSPASRRNGCDFRRMQSPEHWLPWLDGIDAVINCVGIIGERRGQTFTALHADAPIALFEACAHAGVRRVLQISALGADGSAFSAYHLSKRCADDALRALDLDWMVLRPSLIYGSGGRSAALFMRLARLPRIPVVDGGHQTLQPVHIGDVVATVLRALITADTRQTLDIVGPEAVTFAEWLQRQRSAQGLTPTPPLSVPLAWALRIARIARHLDPLFQPDNLRMLATGYHADVAPLARFLGRMPLRATPGLLLSGTSASGVAA